MKKKRAPEKQEEVKPTFDALLWLALNTPKLTRKQIDEQLKQERLLKKRENKKD